MGDVGGGRCHYWAVTDAAGAYRELAEDAWRWVLDQVRWDDGPWIPTTVSGPGVPEIPGDRDGMHSGIGGLAYALAEIRLARPWSAEENELADGIADRLNRMVPTTIDSTFFDGLVSTIGVLNALGASGTAEIVERLQALATPDGWPQTIVMPPRYLPDARLHDLTLGTAGVLLGAVWARRNGVSDAQEVGERAATVILAEAEEVPNGLDWPFVPLRFREEAGTQMPNLSHGVAGIATALALAGAEFGRQDLIAAACRGAEQLVSLGVTDGEGFVVPRYLPVGINDEEEFTFTWCHGASGTSLLFRALEYAGVKEVAGETPLTWHGRCLHSVRTSGLPERLRPGFWDNDGRCCGTAGVGEIFLDSWHRSGSQPELDFALHLADALVERAVREDSQAYWRFTEHRAEEPLLPPGVGWMQGAAGMATFLFHASRAVSQGPAAEPVPRMDTWWTVRSTG